MKKMKKFLCCFLIMVLVFCCANPPKAAAEPITLTITIAASILVVLASTYGIDLAYANASGNNVLSWMQNQLQDYLTRQSLTIEAFGVTLWSAGKWILDSNFITNANAFFADLTSGISVGSSIPTSLFSGSIDGFGISSITPGNSLGSGSGLIVHSFTSVDDISSISYPGFYYSTSSGTTSFAFFYSTSSGLGSRGGSSSRNIPAYGVLYWDSGGINMKFYTSTGTYMFGSTPLSVSLFSNLLNYGVSASIPDTYSPPAVPDSSHGVSITYPSADTSSFIQWADDAGTAAAAGDLIGEREEDVSLDTPVVTPVPGSTTWDDGSIDFWGGLTGTISQSLQQAGQTVATWTQALVTPIRTAVEAIKTWTDSFFSVPETVTASDFTIPNMKTFFPFCIPYDLYDMLNLFRGSRAAPEIDWRFYAPGIVDYTLHLDFSVLDPVAQILRTGELLAFAFGLALATRKLIGA